MPILEAEQLHVRYPGGVHAVRGVDLAVEAGETVALVGESGSGKSTLLKCFNRMVRPSAGTLRLEGQPLDRDRPEHLRRRMGYVQQDGGLLPHWTVRRNVGLVPWLLGWDAQKRERRSAELLDLVGLPIAAYGDRHPRSLSGGQRQRVAFARALAADPHVILLDEPFGALDALRRRELQDEFLRWKQELHKTTLLVTHDLEEALRLADRVAVLREGLILQLGAADELRDTPADSYVEALFEGRSS
jgi:osmoprotectant transport system ATP-binding protein